MPDLELYGTAACPYTSEMREWLEWHRRAFREYDVERDQEARERLKQIVTPPLAVPILLEDGKVIEVGWRGHSCLVAK
jgi:glutaredoxin 3